MPLDENLGTLAPCPRGCGGYFWTLRDTACPSCRRPLNGVTIMEYRWPGACFEWFGPLDHRMRCRLPAGHEGEHSTHNDLNGCGAIEQTVDEWPTRCEMPHGHEGLHDWQLRASSPEGAPPSASGRAPGVTAQMEQEKFRALVLAAVTDLGRFGLEPSDDGIASVASLIANASKLGAAVDHAAACATCAYGIQMKENLDRCELQLKAASRGEEERAPATPGVADCRSEVGETVGLLDAAIVTLRLASRRPRGAKGVQEALADLCADTEIRQLLASALGNDASGVTATSTDSVDSIPRRICLDKLTHAERAIHDAMRAVEEAGADVRLTSAIVLLQRAKDKVADFVDGVEPHDPVIEQMPHLSTDVIWAFRQEQAHGKWTDINFVKALMYIDVLLERLESRAPGVTAEAVRRPAKQEGR